jgi:putative DNA primase/helicase
MMRRFQHYKKSSAYASQATLVTKRCFCSGPRRSGKGTIARVLTGLVGRENVVGPNLSSLVKPFGPAALIGKRVACIADARVGRLTNHDELAERLLSITGEDVQTIDRKYRESWTGRLQVRFIILSNEIPQFDERSGALSSRSIVLALTQSFLGRENLRLTDKLFSELSGILNWGIVGFRRLHSRGYFIQPISGEMLASELEDLSSPIKAFVKERCEISFDKRVECRALYREYGRWTFEQHQSIASRVPPINLFSRDLRAAVPGLKVSQPRINGKQTRVYEGVGLR